MAQRLPTTHEVQEHNANTQLCSGFLRAGTRRPPGLSVWISLRPNSARQTVCTPSYAKTYCTQCAPTSASTFAHLLFPQYCDWLPAACNCIDHTEHKQAVLATILGISTVSNATALHAIRAHNAILRPAGKLKTLRSAALARACARARNAGGPPAYAASCPCVCATHERGAGGQPCPRQGTTQRTRG